MSDGGDELAMPVAIAVPSQQQDQSLNLNPMMQMDSFFQQADGMDDNRDDFPPFPSEPQTPTAER